MATVMSDLRRLGEVTAGMHLTLASEPTDPAFAPEDPSTESLAILAARIDDEALELFASLPDLDVLEPIEGQAAARRFLRMGRSARTLVCLGCAVTIRDCKRPSGGDARAAAAFRGPCVRAAQRHVSGTDMR